MNITSYTNRVSYTNISYYTDKYYYTNINFYTNLNYYTNSNFYYDLKSLELFNYDRLLTEILVLKLCIILSKLYYMALLLTIQFN